MANKHAPPPPEIVWAGGSTSSNRQPRADRSASREKSYDFLETWEIPRKGPRLSWYNFKRLLFRDHASNHQMFLEWSEYLAYCEAARIDYARYFDQVETDYLIQKLRFLDNKGIRPIMAFCNIKSAGKTTDLLYVAAVIAQYTRRFVLAIPATQNNATSTLALMAGISEISGITIEELSLRIKELGTYRALSQEVPKTLNGVGIVSEDANSALKVDNQYNLMKFIELLLDVLPNVDYLMLDLGNDNIQTDTIALAAARFAHVLNFSYMHMKAVATRSFQNTVSAYNTDLQAPDAASLPNHDALKLTGFFTPTPEKVAHSIVIANLAPLDAGIDYDERMLPSQGADVRNIERWKGEGFELPYDPYLDNEDESGVVKPVDLSKISPVTHKQALRIAVANLEEAARVQGIDVSDAPQFTPPPVPVVEHPFPSMLGANRKESS